MTRRALLAETFMRLLYPLLLATSLWVLLRGHNAPGGGFIAGLLAVAASAAYGLVFGAGQALQRLPFNPARLAAGGVLLALSSGLPALWQGRPFLSHHWLTFDLAGASIPLSTVLLFDLGVYLAVWGALGGYCLELVASIEEEVP